MITPSAGPRPNPVREDHRAHHGNVDRSGIVPAVENPLLGRKEHRR
jgi:hypothetical protein